MGGSANSGGESYRADVATRIAIHLLAQSPLWRPSPVDSTPLAIFCEAPDDVDDIAVTTRHGRLLIQAKGNDQLSIPVDATSSSHAGDDAFVKSIAQLIRQQSSVNPASPPFDAITDRFVLVYKDATDVLATLRKIAERLAPPHDISSDEARGRFQLLRTNDERIAFSRFEKVVQYIRKVPPSWEDAIALLRVALFWPLPESITHRIEIDPGNLLRGVLGDGESADVVVEFLSRKILSLAAVAAGVNLEGLRRFLGAKFSLQAAPDYARDIERIRSGSRKHLTNMKKRQRNSFGTQVDRGVTSVLVSALDDGPTVIVGDRGSGKSSVIIALAEYLIKEQRNVVVCDLKQASARLFTAPTDPSLTFPLTEVLSGFPHPLPIYLLIDGLEEIARDRSLEIALLDIVNYACGNPSWRLVVTSRPSILRGRSEICELFRGTPIGDIVRGLESVRCLWLGPFSEKELVVALAKAPPDVRDAVTRSKPLRDFISMPETLALLTEIPLDGITETLWQMSLLQKYWDQKVGSLERQQALIGLSQKLRARGTNSLPLTDCNGPVSTLDELDRDGIISIASGRVTLTHEMLNEFIGARFTNA